MPASVVALFVSTASRKALTGRQRVEALENRGIEGDRHALPGNRRAVLLMSQEILDSFGLAPGDVREQITVRGLDLHALAAGTRLRIGSAVLELAGPCAPCERMEELRPGLQAALEEQRGRFARVVTPGSLAVGDVLTLVPPA
jgi:MOSC domain-containing protein YiiM